jgi:hypothetical protein
MRQRSNLAVVLDAPEAAVHLQAAYSARRPAWRDSTPGLC